MDLRSLKSKKGFTLIELMVVIVIIGILVAIALPNFISAQDRAKLSSVKSNAHTLQTMAETYAVDWGGVYPEKIGSGTGDGLMTEAITKNYVKKFKNPFTSLEGPNLSYMADEISDEGTISNGKSSGVKAGALDFVGGSVGYDSIESAPSGSGVYNKYFIYGADKNAGEAIVDKGANFVLTNQ